MKPQGGFVMPRRLRVRVERKRGLYPKRGLGLYYERGCLGSTYHEEGQNMFFTLTAVVVRWEFTLRATWKRYGDPDE